MKGTKTRARSTIAALLLLALTALGCASLGYWQLERAEQRRDILRVMEQGRTSTPLSLVANTATEELHDWRRVNAQGHCRNDLTVLLENRNHDGRPGYWVATPLALSSEPERAILVLRGWTPRRFAAPGDTGAPAHPPAGELQAASGLQQIQGELLSRVPRMYELSSLSGQESGSLPAHIPDPASPLPIVVNLALDDYAAATGLSLLPAIIQQADDASQPDDGLVRLWGEPSVDADKNIGYAIQWFSFAAIALGAFLVIVWRRLRRPR